MRALLLVSLLFPAPAFAGDLGPVPVDWTRLDTPLAEEEVAGLRRLGFRLEPDGRVLDLELRGLDAAGLAEARRLLQAGERRQRLERLRTLLAAQPPEAPLSADARAAALALADGELHAAINRNEATAAALTRLAGLDLSAVAGAFDGNRAKSAVAVTAPATPPANRPRYPYLTAAEQQVGEALRAATLTQLSNYERGRLILSRLNDRTGHLDIPPILIAPLQSPAIYDVARRAIVIDRETAIEALLLRVPPSQHAARRQDYSRPDGLAQALAADPDVASRLVARNDVLIAHELTHAWQDRRDPLWSHMRQNRVPNAVIFEYEEEANVEKNLYIHDVLRGNPGTYIEPMELEDYRAMMMSYTDWSSDLRRRYNSSSAGVLRDLNQLRDMNAVRRNQLQTIPTTTDQEQRIKASLLSGMTRGSRSIETVQAAHQTRITALVNGPIATAGPEHTTVMARHYLQAASVAPTAPDRLAALANARRYAEASGDADLIQQVQSELQNHR